MKRSPQRHKARRLLRRARLEALRAWVQKQIDASLAGLVDLRYDEDGLARLPAAVESALYPEGSITFTIPLN
jgi:hypothetical protein